MSTVPDAHEGGVTGQETELERFNPHAPGYSSNPYSVYARYREADPVHWGVPGVPGLPGTWFCFRYDDVMKGLRDPRFVRTVSGERPPMPPEYRAFWEMANRWMLFRDPPDHTRLRSIAASAFTPRMVALLEPRVREISDGLMDDLIPGEPLDLIARYTYPLPVIVIAELLGIPSSDRNLFRDWSIAFAGAIDVRNDLEIYRTASEATLEISDYLRGIVAERRSDPRDDLLSALLAAEAEGDRLTEEEVMAMAVLLLVAGHETTANLVANGTVALLENPDQHRLLRERPELLETAVDELLRYDGPVQMTFRNTAEDVELHGKTIPTGEQVGFVLGSANRDRRQFEDPDRLDVTRRIPRHAGFGVGIHFCLGAPLARLEARVAFEAITQRLTDLELATERLTWRESVAFHGLESLPVRFSPSPQ